MVAGRDVFSTPAAAANGDCGLNDHIVRQAADVVGISDSLFIADWAIEVFMAGAKTESLTPIARVGVNVQAMC